MANLILYGVPKNRETILKIINDENLHPVCLCDNSYNNMYFYDFPVLTINEVKRTYADFQVYVIGTEPEVYDKIQFLIQNGHFRKNQIINEIKEKYISCEALENELVIMQDGFRNCCGDQTNSHFDTLPVIRLDENSDFDDRITIFMQMKKEIIRRNIKGERTCCTTCPNRREGYWPVKKKIKRLNLSIDAPCNLLCYYCYKAVRGYKYEQNFMHIPEILDKVKDNENFDLKLPIYYGAGEITINPNADSILKKLQDYNVAFFSNATKYNESLHSFIKKSLSSLVVSLDCGTRETYKKIKNYDYFETVCQNIGKYSSGGGNVMLKYIVTEFNSDVKNIDGFIDICQRNGIKNIRVAKDWRYNSVYEVNDTVKKAAINLMMKAKKHHINFFTGGETVCKLI